MSDAEVLREFMVDLISDEEKWDRLRAGRDAVLAELPDRLRGTLEKETMTEVLRDMGVDESQVEFSMFIIW